MNGRNNGRKIGVFGGTFDPPHLGHMILAQEALDQLKLERVLFVLTADPPHKRDHQISPIESRLKLLQAAIEDNPDFFISRVDIDRPPPYYSIDTVKILADQDPFAHWVYLMGADSLVDLPKWHDPVGFVKVCNGLGVIRRPNIEIDLTNLEKQIPGITQKVSFVDAPLLEIASCDIRQRVRNCQPYRYYVLPGVYELIQQLNLYRD